MVSNRIFLPSSSGTGKRSQFVEYTVERRSIDDDKEEDEEDNDAEEKPWTLEENRTLMLTCRQYMIDNDIKDYSDELYDVVADQIKKSHSIDRTVKEISSKLAKLLESFEKFVSKS